MAEDTAAQNATQNMDEQEQQFIIERIYVKDISFESPNSPQIFTVEWEPDTNLQLTTQTTDMGGDHYEVVLQLTVTVKSSDDKVAFLVEVNQAGMFMIKGYPEEQLHHLLASYCPSNLFPYAREVVANLVSKGSFPEMHLSPINFDALYAQRLQEEQAAAGNGAQPPTEKPG
jgi:preprotein translocase subunit SecB